MMMRMVIPMIGNGGEEMVGIIDGDLDGVGINIGIIGIGKIETMITVTKIIGMVKMMAAGAKVMKNMQQMNKIVHKIPLREFYGKRRL